MRSRTARLVAVVLSALVFGALIAPSAFATRTIGLDKGSFRFSMDPGDSKSGKVLVINDGTEQIQVKVYAANQSFDSSGVATYTVPTNNDNPLTSPASWIRVYLPPEAKSINNTPYLDMAPGRELPIKFDVQVPPGVAPGDHSILLFFETFDSNRPQGAAAAVEGRIGARVKVRVAGTLVEKVTIDPFVVPSFKVGNAVDYSFSLNNQGNVDETVTAGVIGLKQSGERLFETLAASQTIAYAGTSIKQAGTVTYPENSFGPHTLRVAVVYGAQRKTPPVEVAAQRSVWLVPVWVLWVAGALVLLLILLITWGVATRRERRRTEQRRQARRAARQQAGEPPVDSE